MPTTIKLKNSVTTTNAPSSLVQGEVAINVTDKKVWVGNAATTPIQLLGAGSSASFGALTCTSLTNSGLTSGRVTYATTAGLLTDSANMTFNGTTLTVNDLTDSSLTVNRVVYAGTAGNLTNSANFTFNGTTVTMANDASISGLTVGKGGGSVATNVVVGGNGSLGGGSQTGTNNTALGDRTLTANTSGSYNTAVGQGTVYLNTTGSNNSGLGSGALQSNTTGSENTALGTTALYSNTTASNNTAVGYQAGYAQTTGANNTAVGYQAGYAQTTGANSAFFGMNAGINVTTGDGNTYLGRSAGENATTGTTNIAVGYVAGTDAVFNITTASNRIVMGNNNATNAYIKIAWTVTSDARDKTNIIDLGKGLAFVQQLQPKQYQFRTSRTDETPTGNIRYGFLAQDILALEGDNPVIIDNEQPDNLKYNGESLVPVLVKAIQELKAEVDSLKAQLNNGAK